MTSEGYKRRRVLIDHLQLQLLAITLFYFLITSMVFAAAMFVPLVWELRVESPGLDQAQVAAEFLSLHTRFWPALIATFVFVSVHAIFTSHRIVGPLYRFRVVFGEIAAGNLAPWVGIRKRDFLIKEADSLNEMLIGLRERVGGLVALHREATDNLADLGRALDAEAHREARVHLVELESALAREKDHLAGFRLDGD